MSKMGPNTNNSFYILSLRDQVMGLLHHEQGHQEVDHTNAYKSGRRVILLDHSAPRCHKLGEKM